MIIIISLFTCIKIINELNSHFTYLVINTKVVFIINRINFKFNVIVQQLNLFV